MIARNALISGLLAALCAGCVALPVAGPNHHMIDKGAVEALVRDRRDIALEYVLVDISRDVIETAMHVGPDSFYGTFGTGYRPAPELRLGVGDVLAVSIFEASAGGLFVPGDVGARPGNFVTLPPQTVDSKGNITVPFAGEVRAAGRPIVQVQKEIERRLSRRAIEPQVVIALAEQTSAEVAVFGDATGNLKSRIKPGGERVLDIIAKAGLKTPGYEVMVTLQRQGLRSTIYFPALIGNPEENIYVQPGDILYAYRQPQTYIAVGALSNVTQTQGLTGQLTFDSARFSLAEGIAKAGGLLDTRASARHVFLYRMESRKRLEVLGLRLDAFPPEQKVIPTVYRANHRDPAVFFVTHQFPMRHRDIIYVSNADAVEIDKFLSFIRLLTGSAAGISTDLVVTRDAVRALATGRAIGATGSGQ